MKKSAVVMMVGATVKVSMSMMMLIMTEPVPVILV